jgi:hypothetical protein
VDNVELLEDYDSEFEKRVQEETDFRVESFRLSIERSARPTRDVTKKEKEKIRNYVIRLLRGENESSKKSK